MSAYSHIQDRELVWLLKNDDHDAFTEIYHRYSKVVYLHCYKRLKDREQSKDIVQDIFASIWNRRKEFELSTSLSNYLYTAARNRVIKIFAHQDIESVYFSSLSAVLEQPITPDQIVNEKQLKACLEQEIEALPEKMQAVFRMSRQAQRSHKEIAEEFNLSEATVKKQVSNALKILRLKLSSLFSFF